MSEKLAGGPEVRCFDVRSAGDGGNASEIGELWPSPVEKVGILRAKDRQNVCVSESSIFSKVFPKVVKMPAECFAPTCGE
jgi:hypothetical protein